MNIASLLDTQCLGLDLGCWDHPLILGHSAAAIHRSVRGWFKCGDVGIVSFRVTLTLYLSDLWFMLLFIEHANEHCV